MALFAHLLDLSIYVVTLDIHEFTSVALFAHFLDPSTRDIHSFTSLAVFANFLDHSI